MAGRHCALADHHYGIEQQKIMVDFLSIDYHPRVKIMNHIMTEGVAEFHRNRAIRHCKIANIRLKRGVFVWDKERFEWIWKP